VKLGVTVEIVVFPYILGNVIPGTTLSECTKTSPESMYKISDSCVYEQTASGFCSSMNTFKVPRHLKTLGWEIKMPTQRLVAKVLNNTP
jgi:hypothetical protein